MLAEDKRLDLRRRQFQFVRDERAETRGVEHRAQPDHLLPGQTEPLHGELREDVHRIRNHKHDGVLAQSGGFDAVENLHEQRDIAVNQIES